MKKDLRGVAIQHNQTQHEQADDKAQKWVDPYHEKDMTHTHAGNLKL